MNTVSFVVDKLYQNNIIFDREQTKIKVRDNVFDKYYALCDEFNKFGYQVATNDINTIQDSDFVIYVDMPPKRPIKKDINKSFLILMESPLIKPANYDTANHKYFKKIFTWHDDLIGSEKYFKINCAFKIPKDIPKKSNKEKLCCLIVGNKYSNFPNELYGERRKLIRWFENNHPNDFDLYGVGWNEYLFKGSKLLRVFNRLSLARKIMFKFFGDFYPSYRGKVESKFQTMQKYKFAICYENIKDIPGYITDKLLDAFFAGCIPIYRGANNVTDHIPKECFIDRRDFESMDKLYDFLMNMDNDEYIAYLQYIESFLKSEDGRQFGSPIFAQRIVSEVLKKECI